MSEGDSEPPRRPILSGALDESRIALVRIEHDLDEGRYRPGPWQRYIRALARQPSQMRAALAADVDRVSRKLHLRAGRRTISVRAGIIAELVAMGAGLVLAVIGAREDLAAIALIGAILLIISLQPLVKIGAATVAGIGYEYAYLLRGEPRFKMRFGSYIARSRITRILVHLAGTVGSPLGALIAARIIRGSLPTAAAAVMAAFWIIVALNLVLFVAGLAGTRRIARFRIEASSGGVAGIEIYDRFARKRDFR